MSSSFPRRMVAGTELRFLYEPKTIQSLAQRFVRISDDVRCMTYHCPASSTWLMSSQPTV